MLLLMITPLETGSGAAQEEQDLAELLEQYATLRDTILGLEVVKEDLGVKIKAALMAGQHAETDLYRAVIKTSRRLEYPIDRFRETFGDAATLEAAIIDRKKVDALAKAGNLDAEQLKAIANIKEIHSLLLHSKTR